MSHMNNTCFMNLISFAAILASESSSLQFLLPSISTQFVSVVTPSPLHVWQILCIQQAPFQTRDVRYNCNTSICLHLPPFGESYMFPLRPYCPCKSGIPEWLQGFHAGRCDDQMNYLPEGTPCHDQLSDQLLIVSKQAAANAYRLCT